MKKKLFNLCSSVLICVLLIFVFSISVYAESIDNIRVIKISPQDERAVIKTSERELKIIKVGDIIWVASYELRVAGEQPTEERVAGSPVKKYGAVELRVVEIATGRIVFEEMTERGKETVIIRVEDEDSSGLKKQRIERIRKTEDKQPMLYAPIHEGGNRRKSNSFQ